MSRQEAVKELLDPKLLRELAVAGAEVDRAGLLAAVLDAWGGQERLAADLVLEFKKATPGSMVRQRILDLVCRLISQHTAEEKPLIVEDLTDEQLRAALVGLLEKPNGADSRPAAAEAGPRPTA